MSYRKLVYQMKMAKRKLENYSEFKNIYEIVTDDKNIQWAKCSLKNDEIICGVKIKSEIGGYFKKFNLWRHVKRHHGSVYEKLNKEKIETKPENLKQVKNIEQPKIKSFFKSSKINVTMDSETFKNGIIEMVCLNSAPLTMFSSIGFKRIAGEMAQLVGVTLGHDAVRSLIISTAEQARQTLIQQLRGKLLYLKMDAATRGVKNYLAINVQFFNEEQENLCIRTLAIVDTEHSHGSEYIKNQVKQVLDNFEINVNQILSICVDNAANMVRAVKDLSPLDDDNDDMLHIYEEYDLTNEWTSKPELIIPSWLNMTEDSIQVMRCVIHTLQLAIWSGLNTELGQRQLKKIRSAVTKLRTPTIRSLLIKKYGLCQSVDTVTRWGSTFLMIKRLQKFRTYCEEAVATGATELDLDWDAVQNLFNVLEKPYETTVLLQSANLTPGIFMKEWCRLKSFLDKEPGIIAMSILIAMKKREAKIFSNTYFLAAVYVDPRYRILLTEEQIKLAKCGLWNITMRHHKITFSEFIVRAETDNNTTTSTTSEEDEYERELDRIEKRQRLSDIESNDNKIQQKFYESLQQIEKMGRCKADTVFKIISQYPDNLRLISGIASSLPTTQVSVERLFSSLKIIVSDLRQSLKEDLISAILFIRQNTEMLK